MGGLHAEVSLQGQLQNEEEARSHQGSPRVALGKQPGEALSAGRGRWAGHPRAPEAFTHADWVACPLQASTWRYLGISGTMVWLPFSLSS